MSNQPQSRPLFRLATLARASQPQTPAPTSAPRPSQPQTSAPTQAPRPSQPQTPTPTPAPRPQTQPPAPLMPRPGLGRLTSRPAGATQPPPAQETAPQAPAPTTSAPTRPPPSATSAARPAFAAPSPSPAPATTTSVPRAPASTPATAAQPPTTTIHSPPTVIRPPTPTSPVSQKSPPTSSMTLPTPLAATSRSVPPSPPKPSPPAKSQSVPPSPSSPPKASSTAVKQVTPPLEPAFSSLKPYARETIAPSMPTSSPQKPSNGSPVTVRVPNPTESPRAAKPVSETPPQSPKEKASLSPPTPFALPPSQLKSEGGTEKKTVLVQQTAGKPKPYLESQGVDGGSHKSRDGMHVKPKDRHLYKTSSDSEDSGMRVITITGENKGAVMELGHFPKRRVSSLNSPAPHKLKSDGSQLSEGNLSRNEEKLKLQGRNHNAAPQSSVPMHAFTNSNVQGINSSIVYNTSFSHHDPGVHLSVTQKPLNGHGHGFQLKDHASEKSIQKEKGQWFSE